MVLRFLEDAGRNFSVKIRLCHVKSQSEIKIQYSHILRRVFPIRNISNIFFPTEVAIIKDKGENSYPN